MTRIVFSLFAPLFLLAASHGQSPIRIPDYVNAPRADLIIIGLPYSANRNFVSEKMNSEGATVMEESKGSEARDSFGRTFDSGERHWTYLKDEKSMVGIEMLYRIEDPVAKTTTRWSSLSKDVSVIHWPNIQIPEGTSCAACFTDAPNLPSTRIKKLGTRTVQGLIAKGSLMSYDSSRETSVIHEVWYSPDLKIAVLATNLDPEHGNTRDELLEIVRGEPDPSLFRLPVGSAIHESQIPPAQH